MSCEHRPGPQGAERVLDILEFLADQGSPQRFTDLHRRLDIPRPVLSRLLKSLQLRGYVSQAEDGRGYMLGPAVFGLVRGLAWAPHSQAALAAICQPLLNALCQESGHTLMALHYNGRCLESVATATAEEGLAPWPLGTRRDQYQRGPWGIVVLAEQGADDAVLSERIAADSCALPLAVIRDSMDQLGRCGYLTLRRNHSWRIAVPLRAGDGCLVGVLGMFVNPGQINDDEEALISATCACARSINEALALRSGMVGQAEAVGQQSQGAN